MDRKGSKSTPKQERRDNRKRYRPLNRFEIEQDDTVASAATKKLKTGDIPDVSINSTISYKLINFITVFLTISNFVKCKFCNSNITFEETSCRGLGFKLVIKCKSCDPKYIDSCPLIGNAYEVNRRFIFAMRLLGVGLNGAETFCAFMDMPRPIFQSFYDIVVNSIYTVSKAVAKTIMKKSVSEEKNLTREATGQNMGLTVSGDGTWMKRGFSSLFGVASLIGFHTKKVIDIIIKSAYCHACKLHKNDPDDNEHEMWKQEHANHCVANHEGASGKMEVDAICEMFLRSEELYGTQYTHYIGDGDSKTYKAIINSKPYGDKFIVKKECINHV